MLGKIANLPIGMKSEKLLNLQAIKYDFKRAGKITLDAFLTRINTPSSLYMKEDHVDLTLPHTHTPTMILTVTEACPGGMLPSESTASTVNVYVALEPLSAS